MEDGETLHEPFDEPSLVFSGASYWMHEGDVSGVVDANGRNITVGDGVILGPVTGKKHRTGDVGVVASVRYSERYGTCPATTGVKVEFGGDDYASFSGEHIETFAIGDITIDESDTEHLFFRTRG